MPIPVQAFLAKWQGSSGAERRNAQSFLNDFCDLLGVDRPGQELDYCFERGLPDTSLEGKVTTKAMDLYKKGHFILEAKQATEKQRGGANKRGPTLHTPMLPGLSEPGAEGYHAPATYDALMERAFGQAVNYAKAMALIGDRPPFLIVADIGHSFRVWNRYDPKAGGGYGGFGAGKVILLEELEDPDTLLYFRKIWTNPAELDESRARASVTRAIARELGKLAMALNRDGADKQATARFLMRCVFTCFAEDAGLLPNKVFQEGLAHCEQNHKSAQGFLADWWKTMDAGGKWGWNEILRFNGGLFRDITVPVLSQQQIALLHLAAKENWSNIEPAIFGTLLESALDEKERHALGAHYTPRAYIQRLVDATFGDQLRAEWEAVETDLAKLLEDGATPEAAEKARVKLRAFHDQLAAITVLDPACGSGNFLYVAFDTLKRLEAEVLRRLEELGEHIGAFDFHMERISPKQFMGIEVNPWAAQIAELVLWIAYLQWFRKRHPKGNPPEPVLQNYGSIREGDAVLAWSGIQETGQTRWGGRLKPDPITGREIPDPTDQVRVLDYQDPSQAPWPKADYILGNPPFLGNSPMRDGLGSGYVDALRAAYPEVPDTVDFVLYWWHRAAEEVRAGRTKAFGLITTNSLRQVRNRGVIARQAGLGLKLRYALPDHPWAKDEKDAAVRIAMTVGVKTGAGMAVLARVTRETRSATPEEEAEAVVVGETPVALIHPDLSAGAAITEAAPLMANGGLACRGMELGGSGFMVEPIQFEQWGRPAIVHPYRNGRDLTDRPRGVMVIDAYGLSETELRQQHPAIYQHLYRTVKPERVVNNVVANRNNWWLFRRPHPEFRPALKGLARYLATVETAKHRVFQFLDGAVVPDNKLVVIASAAALHLGVLSSRIHGVWALAAGARLGVGNDPVYPKTTCFDPFPFPDPSPDQAKAIGDLAEELDAHRKAAQSRGATLTQQYNLLEKLRRGEAFTAADRKLDAAALPEVLRQLHDRLDEAVAQAYGWPVDLAEGEILERLVALNAARRAEEAAGTVRWLRPDYQSK